MTAPFDWLAEAMGNAAEWMFVTVWKVFDTTTFVDIASSEFTSVYSILSASRSSSWWPITAATEAELVTMIRQHLRPPDQPGTVPERARTSREELRRAISHRPSTPNTSPGL